MAQKIKIDGKEYSCSKEVAEHIKWLEMQVSVSKDMTQKAKQQLEEFQKEVNIQFEVLDGFINQIKPI